MAAQALRIAGIGVVCYNSIMSRPDFGDIETAWLKALNDRVEHMTAQAESLNVVAHPLGYEPVNSDPARNAGMARVAAELVAGVAARAGNYIDMIRRARAAESKEEAQTWYAQAASTVQSSAAGRIAGLVHNALVERYTGHETAAQQAEGAALVVQADRSRPLPQGYLYYAAQVAIELEQQVAPSEHVGDTQ